MTKKSLIALGAGVGLLVLALTVGPMLIPADAYIGRVAAAVKQATGRDLAIAGPVSIRLVPNIALEAQDVSLSGAPGGAEKTLASIGKLEVGLKLIPLLARRIEISRLDLDSPVIRLEVDKSGHGNWMFDQPGAAAKPKTDAAPKEPADLGAQLSRLSLGAVRIVNGTVSYFDARSGKRETVTEVDTVLTLSSIDDPLSFKGNATWHDQTVSLEAEIQKPLALVDGGTTPVTVKLDAELAKLALAGDISSAGPLHKVEGKLDLSGSSLRTLLTWIGSPPKLSGSALGPFALHTNVNVGASLVSLSKLTLTLDKIKASGDVSVATGSTRPQITGALALGTLDLNPYLATSPAGDAAHPEAAPIAAPASTGGAWSAAPIDLSALRTMDVTLTLSLDSLRFHDIEIGKSVIAVTIASGKLRTDFRQLTLYGGSGTGHIVLDGSTGGVVLQTEMTLGTVQIQPVLQATIGVSRMSGTGSLSIALAGRGGSQADLMRGLSGMGSLRVANGAVKGFDLAAIVHNPMAALTENSSTAQTAFSALGATFKIADGVATNLDLAMETGVGGVTGSGTIDLYHRTLDYRIEPHVASTLQGGKSGIYGTTVPIVISGPWADPRYAPDLAAVAQQKLQKALGGKASKLLGGSGASGQAGALLKGLFGH